MSLSEFKKIVNNATHEQRHNLAKLTGSVFGSDTDTLCNHIRYLRSGVIGQVFCDKSWKQIVTDVADHIQIDWSTTLKGRHWKQLQTYEIETAVVYRIFQDIFNQLSPERQEQVVMEMKRNNDDPNVADLLATGGAITAAKVSGFGVYLTASTVLGSLTSALGITLPFAAYMGMSQAIAIVIGPVGWLALLGGLTFKLNQPNWKRLTLAVVYISVIRNTP